MEFKQQYQQTFAQVRPRPDFLPEDLIVEKQKTLHVRKLAAFVLAAALIMALSVTAYATELFGLMDYLYPDVRTEEGQSEGHSLSLAGMTDRPESKALQEWNSYYWNKEPVFLPKEEEQKVPMEYRHYGAYTPEDREKLDEILAKYNLQKQGQMHDLRMENGAVGYIYDCGTFKLEHNFVTQAGDTIGFQLMRCVYGYFTNIALNIGDHNAYETREYTTSDGQKVLLAVTEGKGLLLSELEDSFVTVNCLPWGAPLTLDDLQTFAEQLDIRGLADIQ